MKQILQNLSNGNTLIEDVPIPAIKKGSCIIKSSKSLVSAGTERMLVDFGKANLLEKAINQPDKVKQVLDKVKTDGVKATFDSVKSKLDNPLPLGYCNVGKIIESSDTLFKTGDRVVSNGYHAEYVRVPKNLIAKIPNDVDDETASYAVIGSIALQGIRLLSPSIGEVVVVTGLGLIGLIAVQILVANGCKVIGIDFDEARCNLAESFGADTVNLTKNENPNDLINSLSNGRGADGVIIAASTKSNEVIKQSAQISRKRGKIILIGQTGLNIDRSDFYEKELTFQVSCSYGPGRYDYEYEEEGIDYPYSYVRWTEQRNFEAILGLMEKKLINVSKLTSHQFDINDAKDAYRQLDDKNSLGIMLNYNSKSSDIKPKDRVISLDESTKLESGKANISFIGSGNYASRVLIPAFKNTQSNLLSLISSGGVSSTHFGKKNNFKNASTDFRVALEDESDAIIIATQHNIHAQQVTDALNKGKHVFVEKPLAINTSDLDEIYKAHLDAKKILMVGFNRRFAPHIIAMKELLDKKPQPKTFIMTMNAGRIPKDHWTQDINIGGGRIIGEACHYIDLMRFLVGSKIEDINAICIGENDYEEVLDDKSIISISFEDGSVGCINYFSNGGNSYPKERIEVFCDNGVLQIDNFIKMRGFDWKGFKKMNLWSQDKGQQNCVNEFVKSICNTNVSPIPSQELYEVAEASIKVAELLKNNAN